MINNLKIKGLIYLGLVPALLIILTIFYLIFPLVNLLIVEIYSLTIFLALLLFKNKYTDSQVLDTVVIPNAPREIDELLRKKTRTNRLINANLIEALGKRRKLSQSDLVEEMKKRGIEYSQPAIEKYLAELETAELVESKKAYKKEYHLTERGKWCYEAVETCFPNRFFFFIVRHYLGIRKLRPYPD
jgi:predicted transcriptional regulator